VQQGGNQKCYVRFFLSLLSVQPGLWLIRTAAALATLLATAPTPLVAVDLLRAPHPLAVLLTHRLFLLWNAIAVEVPTIWQGAFPKGLLLWPDLDELYRDCLAAPGTLAVHDSIPTGPSAANINKNKTCYKCQQEGHVSLETWSICHFTNPLSRLLVNVLNLTNSPVKCRLTWFSLWWKWNQLGLHLCTITQ